MLEVEDGAFDLDLGCLPVEEKMEANERFMADLVIGKLSFPQPHDMTTLRKLPKIIKFDPNDPKVHQLNLNYAQGPGPVTL